MWILELPRSLPVSRNSISSELSSKWAKRILKRGFKAQDEGARTAIADQLQQHALLTWKINSMNDNNNSDETSDNDTDEISPGSDSKGVFKLLNKAKEETIKAMEEEDEIPKSGVFALPFMERSLKKQREAAHEEAHLARQEYESSMGNLEGDVAAPLTGIRSGRRIFVEAKSQPMILRLRLRRPTACPGPQLREKRGSKKLSPLRDSQRMRRTANLPCFFPHPPRTAAPRTSPNNATPPDTRFPARPAAPVVPNEALVPENFKIMMIVTVKVVKRAGVIINPIKYEDIDPYGKSEDSKEPKQSTQKKSNMNIAKLVGQKVSKKL